MNPLWRVDFHCHTVYSKDSLTRPEDLLAALRGKNLDRLVVTDHNSIEGGLRARELDPERVIVGEEIMTDSGELLALYVEKRVPAGLAPEDTIGLLREQGAFISVSHPFDQIRGGSWQLKDLTRIAQLVDAVEVFNSRCLDGRVNGLAAAFAAQHRLPGTAGSDAHTLSELGRAALVLPPFAGAEGLKESLREARVDGRLSGAEVHFYSTFAKLVKRMKGI